MLSLPPIFPQDPRTQSASFASSLFRPPSPPSIFDNPPATHPHHPQQPPRPRPSLSSHRNIHTHLNAQATALSARRQAIARFGATWLRPPGCPKTLQALSDEAAEREEQEMLARRERELLEQQMAAEEVERQIRRQQDGIRGVLESQGDGAGGGEGERDLDEDVPEGEDVGMGMGDEDIEDDEEEDELGDDASSGPRDLDEEIPEAEILERFFNEVEDDGDGNEEGIEDDDGADQTMYTDGSGMPRLQADMEIEHDLDASIPDADRGWQHTDTDVEATSSFLQPSSQRRYEQAEREAARQVHAGTVHARGNGAMRMNLGRAGQDSPLQQQQQGTPSVLDSSWIGSSPAFARTSSVLPSAAGGGGGGGSTGNAFRNRLMRETGRGGS